MENVEVEKSKAFNIAEIAEYASNAVIGKTIIKKLTGNISVMALDTGEGIAENVSPFDNFIQIIEGSAEIFIDRQLNLLDTGQAIVIPAHAANTIKAHERFKMVLTIIKSGYE